MTRRYEIVYIFDSALEEAQVNEALDRHHALLKSADNPEPVKKVDHWGKRTLAYPIQNSTVGYYVVVDARTEAAALPEFERALKLDESVIRYLLVLNEGAVPATMPERTPDREEGGGRPGARPAGKPAATEPAAERPAAEQPATEQPATDTAAAPDAKTPESGTVASEASE